LFKFINNLPKKKHKGKIWQIFYQKTEFATDFILFYFFREQPFGKISPKK